MYRLKITKWFPEKNVQNRMDFNYIPIEWDKTISTERRIYLLSFIFCQGFHNILFFFFFPLSVPVVQINSVQTRQPLKDFCPCPWLF